MFAETGPTRGVDREGNPVIKDAANLLEDPTGGVMGNKVLRFKLGAEAVYKKRQQFQPPEAKTFFNESDGRPPQTPEA